MKKLSSILGLVLTTVFTLPAAAYYTCSGPPIATGTVGVKAGPPDPQYVTQILPWSGPPAESYSLGAFTNFGGPTKLSFGAASGAVAHFGADCVLGGLPCVAWPTNDQTWRIDTQFVTEAIPGGTQSVAISRWTVSGVKVMELYGLGALTGLQSTQTFSGQLSVIRQDTGSNSSFWFEGWNTVNGVTTWKSVKAKFLSNQC